ncbi:unnamed protein product [Linum tenue]|uniref:Uncharacterized protein n=1 Tax=Linum tenue TaxID=586396 RepID=A0AAV0RJM7_9ROSI|nr:unnamed protein product [Linum tenue]
MEATTGFTFYSYLSQKEIDSITLAVAQQKETQFHQNNRLHKQEAQVHQRKAVANGGLVSTLPVMLLSLGTSINNAGPASKNR